MKSIFMLLILFVLTDPVMANPANNTSECLNMYRTYMNDYGASRFIPDAQMLNFIGKCLPADSANNSINNPANSEPQYQKRLQNINNDKRIITIKT